MILHSRTIGPSLASAYPRYAEVFAEYERAAAKDMREAERIYAQLQDIAKAFWAGAEFASRGSQ